MQNETTALYFHSAFGRLYGRDACMTANSCGTPPHERQPLSFAFRTPTPDAPVNPYDPSRSPFRNQKLKIFCKSRASPSGRESHHWMRAEITPTPAQIDFVVAPAHRTKLSQ